MVTIEAKEVGENKIGGNGLEAKRGKSRARKNRQRFKRNGYIRCKKTKGRRGILRYYFYCYCRKQPDGSFREVSTYLGTADRILKIINDAKERY